MGDIDPVKVIAIMTVMGLVWLYIKLKLKRGED